MSKDQDGSLEAISFNPELKASSPNFNKSANPVLLIPSSLFQKKTMNEEEEGGGRRIEEGGGMRKEESGGGGKREEGGGGKKENGGGKKEEKGGIKKIDGRRMSGGREEGGRREEGRIGKIVVTKVVEEKKKGNGQKGGGWKEKIGGVGSAILKGEHSLLSQEGGGAGVGEGGGRGGGGGGIGGGDSSILGLLKQSSDLKFTSPLRRREILTKPEVYVAEQIIKVSPSSNNTSLTTQQSPRKSDLLKPKPLIPQKHLSFFAAKPVEGGEISEIKSALVKKREEGEGRREEGGRREKERMKEEEGGWKVENGWKLEGIKKEETIKKEEGGGMKEERGERKEEGEGRREEGGGRKEEGGGRKEEGGGRKEEGGGRKEEGGGKKEEGGGRKEDGRKEDIPVMKAKLFSKNEHSKSTQLKPPQASKTLFTPQARQSIKININIKTLDSARENFRVFKGRLMKMGGEVGKDIVSEEVKKEIRELGSGVEVKQYRLKEGDRMLLEKVRGMAEEGRGGRSCSFNFGGGDAGRESARKASARMD